MPQHPGHGLNFRFCVYLQSQSHAFPLQNPEKRSKKKPVIASSMMICADLMTQPFLVILIAKDKFVAFRPRL